MNCRQCGQMLNANQVFCENCGTKVEQGQVVNNNMYQQNNQMYQQNQYQQPKIRYHWEYGCLCIFIFLIPYFLGAIISFFPDTSIIQSSFYKGFRSICALIGLCTVPVFIIEAIVYSIRVKNR